MGQSRDRDKFKHLVAALKRFDSLVVAFSGGVDSSFLLAVACQAITGRVVAVTAESPVHPVREKKAAAEFARRLGVEHVIVKSGEMKLSDFVANSKDRCYICKKHVLTEILNIASQMGICRVAHGANVDDLGDYRPGLKAAEEMGVAAPLVEAGLGKDEIRRFSREINLNTWNKPSMACLASRIPYGTSITPAALNMVERAEDVLLGLGFRTCRVRYHGRTARIEVDPGDMQLLLKHEVREKVVAQLKRIGFTHVAADLEGYVQGSMNRDLGSGAGTAAGLKSGWIDQTRNFDGK